MTHTTKPKDPMAHLEAMPPYTMMLVQARIEKRLEAFPYTDDERRELSRWILHRMMENRIKAGNEFDSILDASRIYFAKALLAKGLDPAN